MSTRYEDMTPEERDAVDAVRARRRTPEARADLARARELARSEFPPRPSIPNRHDQLYRDSAFFVLSSSMAGLAAGSWYWWPYGGIAGFIIAGCSTFLILATALAIMESRTLRHETIEPMDAIERKACAKPDTPDDTEQRD